MAPSAAAQAAAAAAAAAALLLLLQQVQRQSAMNKPGCRLFNTSDLFEEKRGVTLGCPRILKTTQITSHVSRLFQLTL